MTVLRLLGVVGILVATSATLADPVEAMDLEIRLRNGSLPANPHDKKIPPPGIRMAACLSLAHPGMVLHLETMPPPPRPKC